MEFIALAIAPGIAICLFIFHRDRFNREPKLNLVLTFILGAVTVFPAAIIENRFMPLSDNSIAGTAVTAFLIVALTEEFVKFAVLRLYAYPKKSFDEPLDGIVFAVVASMGFATAENVMYVLKAAEIGDGYKVAFLRMFLSVPAHATFGVLMGYHVGKAKFDKANSTAWMVRGLFWAVVFHGLFDFFLFLQQSPDVAPYVSELLLFIGAVVSFIIGMRLSWKHIEKHRVLSQQTLAVAGGVLTVRKAYPADIPLIRELSFKIWPDAYASILSKEQMDYMLDKMYNETTLKEQMEKGDEFIILYDGIQPIGFASVGPIALQTYKLHKIYILPTSQGKGAGRFVIEQILQAMKTKGATSLQLNVNRHNNAKDFYEKMGFAVISEEDNDIGNGYFMNDYVMEKKVV